jgi:predicted metalloprotease
MRWEDERQSENVEDRRGDGPGGAGPFGGGFGMGRGGGPGFPIPMGRMGIGGIIVVVILMFVLGIDPSAMLGGGSGPSLQPAPQSRPQGVPGDVATRPATQSEDQMRRFVGAVLGSTEDVWRDQLPRQTGQQYQEPTLVLFSGATNTACGMGQAAMGPFYCPPDRKVYIDLSFYDDLARRFKAPGDFAQAYVIAHEIGHHIQNLLGISARMQQMRRQVSETEYNQMSVRVELQADCFAGVWGFHANRTRNILEAGDIDEALGAAAAIGDDRLQKRSRGYAVPDSFTHGSSEQRVRWFKRGFESGQMGVCDTFQAQQL